MNFFSPRARLAVFTLTGGLIVATSIVIANASAGQASRAFPDSKITCTANTPCLYYANDGSGDGIAGAAAGNGAGLYGLDTDSSANGRGAGVAGVSKVQDGVYGSSQVKSGVYGTSTDLDGVFGTAAANGAGVYGANTDSSTSGFGAGVAGVSQVQYGVYGSSVVSDGVFATAAGNGAGVYGANTDSSTSGVGAGVAGVSQVQNGIYGSSVDLNGVFGTAAGNGEGVYGVNTDSAVSGTGAGVAGFSQEQIGVLGSSTNYVGLYGTSSSYVGVYAISLSNDGAYGTTADANSGGVYGDNTDSTASGSGAGVVGAGQKTAGVYGSSQDVSAGYFTTPSSFSGVLGTGANGSGVSAYNNNHTYSALYGEADDPAGSPLFAINNSTKKAFFVNSNGDGVFSGRVLATAFVIHMRTRDGDLVQSYAAKSAEDTIEDTGSGSIVLGSGIVRFDPNFARAIDASRGYQVLITPDGDNRGLFVSYKSPLGFAVREAQGGRSSIAFDYRVVAYPIGGDPRRLATASVVQPPFEPSRLSDSMFAHRPLAQPRARLALVKHAPLAPHALRPLAASPQRPRP